MSDRQFPGTSLKVDENPAFHPPSSWYQRTVHPISFCFVVAIKSDRLPHTHASNMQTMTQKQHMCHPKCSTHPLSSVCHGVPTLMSSRLGRLAQWDLGSVERVKRPSMRGSEVPSSLWSTSSRASPSSSTSSSSVSVPRTSLSSSSAPVRGRGRGRGL